MRAKYMIVPKNGNGCIWYTNDDIFATGYIKVFDKDGFQSILDLDIDKYIIVKEG